MHFKKYAPKPVHVPSDLAGGPEKILTRAPEPAPVAGKILDAVSDLSC
jgi:hypothetical protein